MQTYEIIFVCEFDWSVLQMKASVNSLTENFDLYLNSLLNLKPINTYCLNESYRCYYIYSIEIDVVQTRVLVTFV